MEHMHTSTIGKSNNTIMIIYFGRSDESRGNNTREKYLGWRK